MGTERDLIGSKEACDLLDIARPTLSKWVALGKLKPVAQLHGKNGAFLFERDAVLALMSTPSDAA